MPTKTKTTAKKTTAKKSSTKKTKSAATKKQGVVRALVCAVGEECFWTTDGQVLEDLNQLYMAFGSMDDQVFLHHVTKERNDFADWVEAVLKDTDCAAALRKAKKPTTAQKVTARFLKTYAV